MSKIAIVGIGCRFADAPDLQSYWQQALEGRNAFGPIPADRWQGELFHSESRRAADKSYAPNGAFIEDVRSFPALSLGIPPRRVEVMDPQQRFSLEVCRQAVEDAGLTPSDLPARTGVFIGITATEWRGLITMRQLAQSMATGSFGEAPDDPNLVTRAVSSIVPPRPYSAPGVLGNMCAATVAQELNLKGPAYTVDSACASSLIAMYDAILQLQTGALDAALTGGVYLCLTPDHHVAFSRIGAMSQEGVCRPFDHRADGFVQGDGAAVVLIKRLEDAERDGDRIYAVIEGMALNSDGSGDGPMAPNREGQGDVIRRAWEAAGLDSTNLGYIETHGTGTPVGDPTEVAGLMDTLGPQTQRAALGSSKANIGHTMSAAGVAGLIRAALSLYHGKIPPMANFEVAREDLNLENTPFFIPTEVEEWKGRDRVAAVSSFGFGGTNAHAVLSNAASSSPEEATQPELVLLSAPTQAELFDLATRTAHTIDQDPTITVAGVAKAWNVRPPQKERLAVVASTRESLVTQLEEIAGGGLPEGAHLGTALESPKVAFLFPGQGAQRPGMLRSIKTRFPSVETKLQELNESLNGVLSRPLMELIYPELRSDQVSDSDARVELTETANCQPALMACGVALADLLQRVGVEPVVTTGHSLGEFTAAAVAGVLSAEDALRFVAGRGQAMASLEGDHGAMVALRTSYDEAAELLVDGTVIANINHPKQVVASGSTAGIAQVIARAVEAGIEAIPLEVSHGFHSPVLEDLDVTSLVAPISFGKGHTDVVSAIDGCAIRDGEHARAIFEKHALSPVRFLDALRACDDMGVDIYLQVAAGGPLSSFVRGTFAGQSKAILSLASMDDEDGGAGLLSNLGRLFTLGIDLDLHQVIGSAAVASLPPTVLPREDYWCIKTTPGQAPTVDVSLAKTAAADRSLEEEAETPALEPQTDTDDLAASVMGVVARVSAYPQASLKPSMTLMGTLGFDSLMVADLVAGLSDLFEQVQGIPQEFLVNNPTVADLVDYVRMTVQLGPQEAQEKGPLRSFRPVWRFNPLRKNLGATLSLDGKTTLLVGGRNGTAQALEKALGRVGAKVVRHSIDSAHRADATEFIFYAAPLDAPSTSRSEDPAGPLIAILDRQARLGVNPHTVLLASTNDSLADPLAAVLRCVRREWPQSLAKAILVDPAMPSAQIARSVLEECAGPDRTVDVRYDQAGRQTLGFEEAQLLEPFLLGPEDRVLITGGTRGIGLKLANHLSETGAEFLLLGRSAPSEEAQQLCSASEGRIQCVRADVLSQESLSDALLPHGEITTLIHGAGLLADGPLGSVDSAKGALARGVKAQGLLNVLSVAGTGLRRVLGIGSLAARFGNRHQSHYGAGNAHMAAILANLNGIQASCIEFGPWADSDMVRTIPAAIKAQMQADGVDFLEDAEGLVAIAAALGQDTGPLIQARRQPLAEEVTVQETLSAATHPYLGDHAIDGLPILPLASAADLMAHIARPSLPFELKGLRLFRGVMVAEETPIETRLRGSKVELYSGADPKLSYRCELRPADLGALEIPNRVTGGEPALTTLGDFYESVTFHGPLLQGIVSIEGVGESFVRGRVRCGQPSDWIPGSERSHWTIDPLALDSAMQMAGLVAWDRYERTGTPFGIGSYVQLKPFASDELEVEIIFGEATEDRFSATIAFYDQDGELLALARNVVAELKKVDKQVEETFELKPEWTDPSLWQPVKDMKLRLQMADAMGIGNPYFHVHEGTARDTTHVAGRSFVHFSGYNYLGLSGDPRVISDVKEAVDRYGTSVSASRVASGERPFHLELEEEIARAQGVESALLFTAGHAANVSTIGHLMGADDLIIHDELIHDSALGGIKMSGASRRSFRHEDPQHLERQLRELRGHYQKVLIIVEGVYSMDGDICNLPAYIAVKRKYGCLLMVDEAHSFGVIGATGQGCREHFGLAGDDVDVWMGTLSKSLASCGGWIAGSKALLDYLRYTVGGFVFSAGMTPANAVAGLSSLRLMLEEPERVQKLQRNARFFHGELVRHGLDTGPALGGSAVVPVVTGNSIQALFLSKRLMDEGINVQPIVFPAVADDAARLRFFLTCLHKEEQLADAAETTARLLAEIRESPQFRGKSL